MVVKVIEMGYRLSQIILLLRSGARTSAHVVWLRVCIINHSAYYTASERMMRCGLCSQKSYILIGELHLYNQLHNSHCEN